EDGIRDKLVTGVQTCALPISGGGVSRALVHPLAEGRHGRRHAGADDHRRAGRSGAADGAARAQGGLQARGVSIQENQIRKGQQRSEERRVGKEWIAAWTPYA